MKYLQDALTPRLPKDIWYMIYDYAKDQKNFNEVIDEYETRLCDTFVFTSPQKIRFDIIEHKLDYYILIPFMLRDIRVEQDAKKERWFKKIKSSKKRKTSLTWLNIHNRVFNLPDCRIEYR